MAAVPVNVSASVPVKVSGKSKLVGAKSNYVFIRFAGPDEWKSYDKIDFGLFGRSWIANICWSIVFAPGVTEDNWINNLPSASENFMDTGDVLYVIASGCTNGVFFASDERATHAVRDVVPLNELKTDALVQSGGSLFLRIGLMNILDSADVNAQTTVTFDGQIYWNLYTEN